MAGLEDSSSKNPGFAERLLSGNRDGRFGHILLKNSINMPRSLAEILVSEAIEI